MKRWIVAALILGAAGCVKSNAVSCDPSGDWVCPEGTVCDEVHHLCMDPSDLAACADKAENAECGADPVTGAARFCSQGLCITAVCGDGLMAGTEECDDANVVTGDGCSGACKTERCGNGTIDPIRVDAQGQVSANEECDDGGFLDHDGCSSTCQLETPRWTQHFASVEARGWPAMAYDSFRNRIVAFGGDLYPSSGNGRFSADTLEWDGRDWSVIDVPGPQGRFAASMVYDSDRREIVLFGGEVAFSNYLNDMWRWDGVSWTQVVLPAGATVPPARSRAAMAYDPQRHVIVLYGGKKFENNLVSTWADTWEWDGTSWTKVFDASPPGGREHAGVAYDPAMGGVVIVGGDTYSAVLSDTWLYRNQIWQQLATALPTQPTAGLGVAYDIAGGRLIAFGGNANAANTTIVAPQTATMVWDGSSAWTVAGVTAPTTGRSNVVLAANLHQVIALGGRSANGAGPIETLILTPSNGWAPPAALGPRFGMSSANLRERGSAIIYGGQIASGIANATAETFELTRDGFVSRGTSGPPARSFAAMAYDPAHRNIVLFGGSTPGGYSTETWVWNNGWTAGPTTGPVGRADAQMAFDGQQVTLLGGDYYAGANNISLADAWGWNGTAWSMLSFSLPSSRFGGVAAFDPLANRLVGNGGRAVAGGPPRNDSFTVASGVLGTEASSPIGNVGSTLTWNPARQRLTLVGGLTESSLNAYELDPVAARWIPVPVTSTPPGRAYSATVASIDGSGLRVMGGSVFGVGLLSDTWELSWQGPGLSEQCGATDVDKDGLVGCADPDCWWVCTPACPPGTPATCDSQGPRCGDGVCDTVRESCVTCPGDCNACNLCGDGVCDAGETCAGDCP